MLCDKGRGVGVLRCGEGVVGWWWGGGRIALRWLKRVEEMMVG